MRIIAVLSLVLAASGCSLFEPKIEIREVPAPIVCDVTDKPDALNLKDTPPTLVMGPDEIWGYWFTASHYAAMAENIQAMRRWMNQSAAIRKSLIDCIESHNLR